MYISKIIIFQASEIFKIFDFSITKAMTIIEQNSMYNWIIRKFVPVKRVKRI